MIKQKYTYLSALAVVSVLSASACTMHKNSPTDLPPGEYSRTEQSTNSAGTETQTTTNTKVYYDEHGNKRARETTETSRDPSGLLNKTTKTTTKQY